MKDISPQRRRARKAGGAPVAIHRLDGDIERRSALRRRSWNSGRPGRHSTDCSIACRTRARRCWGHRLRSAVRENDNVVAAPSPPAAGRCRRRAARPGLHLGRRRQGHGAANTVPDHRRQCCSPAGRAIDRPGTRRRAAAVLVRRRLVLACVLARAEPARRLPVRHVERPAVESPEPTAGRSPRRPACLHLGGAGRARRRRRPATEPERQRLLPRRRVESRARRASKSTPN